MTVDTQQQVRMKRLAIVIGLIAAMVAALLIAQPHSAQAADFTTHISLTNSTGDGVPGAKILYWRSGSWGTLGYTDDTGVLATSVANQNYRIRMEYYKGAVDSVTPVDVTNYALTTHSVRILNTGHLAYQGWYQGYGAPAWVNPMELLPYTYSIWNNSGSVTQNKFNVTVGDENVIAVGVRLLDSEGNGLSGGTLSYYIGGWHAAPGTTDANGNLVVYLPSDSPSMSMAMSYNGTRQQMNRTELNASNFTFHTAKVNVKLVDADGAALGEGSAAYYASGWHSLGSTTNGVVSTQMLPGSYSFAMSYNGSREQRDGVAITTPSTDVVFQTGRVTLQYSDAVSWYFNGWRTFAKPTMEYLPGTTTFYFGPNPNCQIDFPIVAGDHQVKSVIVARLKNSTGSPLEGGSATAYVSGAWRSVGTTNANGVTCAAFDGKAGNTAVAMVYNGTRQQISQQHATNSIYQFATAAVTVELRNSNGNLIDAGAPSYYASKWWTLDSTVNGTTAVQMLPGSYAFAMVYNGTREQQNAVPVGPGATTVTFSTIHVTVRLIDSQGNALDGGTASYYASGWRTIGEVSDGGATTEMLKGSYAFAMVYLGAHAQQNAVVVAEPSTTVDFQTGAVHSDSGNAKSFYAASWKTFAQDMELLPGKYSFSFTDGPNQQFTIVGGSEVNRIH
ncbi:MAG: hypothetical protein M9890_02030 [Thermomicrobiales bacterium]|nr:hypothetical protein [Thermomicrobiales bacterium]